MAPYNPPNAHYTQLDVSAYSDNMMLCMVGKGGKGFYHLTSKLGVTYLWYNQPMKTVEIWGSYGALKAGAKNRLWIMIDNFSKRFH